MSEGKFATSVSCIDGRIQIPLAKWIKENYSVDYVDAGKFDSFLNLFLIGLRLTNPQI